MKDWKIRALKTFVQAFGGVLVPEICVILSGNMPTTFKGAMAALFPVISAALAAGISAAWNIVKEKLEVE